MPLVTMGVKLDKKTRDRLKRLGKARQRSPHWLMKVAIEGYLEREEAYERERQEDMQRWEEYRLTGEHIADDAMMEWLDELERET
jgi:predicted transcriptional regulator